MNKVPFIGSRVPQDFQTGEMLVQTNTQKSIIKSFYKVLEKPAEHFLNSNNSHWVIIMKNKTDHFSAFIGLDWADQKHDISVVATVSDKPIHQVIPHTPEALTKWLTKLREEYPDGQIAICLEQSKGSLIYHLLGYDFLTIFPVNPKSLSRFRETFTNSGAKSDFADADYLRELVAVHTDRLIAWKPDDEQTRSISFLAENRRKTVNERIALTNQLKATLKMYFPQAIELAGNTLHRPLALDFLSQWPQLLNVQRAQTGTIKKFYTSHNSRSSERISKRIQLINSAQPLTNDQAVIKSCLIRVKMFINQIAQLNSAIEEFDQELKSLYNNHPDKKIFDSFPGSGDALGPRLLAAWGTDRKRYGSASCMQKYSGTAPITIASGKSKIVVRRVACPKFLLQTFHEFASCSRRYSVWAQAFYEMKRQQGKKHHSAVRSLAFKWLRIMFRCWQNKTVYDEVKYLQALRKSGSPLLKFI